MSAVIDLARRTDCSVEIVASVAAGTDVRACSIEAVRQSRSASTAIVVVDVTVAASEAEGTVTAQTVSHARCAQQLVVEVVAVSTG